MPFQPTTSQRDLTDFEVIQEIRSITDRSRQSGYAVEPSSPTKIHKKRRGPFLGIQGEPLRRSPYDELLIEAHSFGLVIDRDKDKRPLTFGRAGMGAPRYRSNHFH